MDTFVDSREAALDLSKRLRRSMFPQENTSAQDLSFKQRYEKVFGWSMPGYQDEVLPFLEDDSLEEFMLLASPGHAKPLDENSLVLMDDGSRKLLKDVAVGDRVITHTGLPKPVTAVHEQGELPTLRIQTFSGREIFSASDHPFLTTEGWVHAARLKEGMSLAVSQQQLTVPSESDITLEASRLMGYLIGDGSISSGNCSVTNSDEEIIEDIQYCAHSLGFGCNKRKYPLWSGEPSKSFVLRLVSGVRPWLRRPSIDMQGRTSHTKRVPHIIFTADADVVRNFIAAYFDCDGTLNKKGKARSDVCVSFSSVSRELLLDVLHLLARLGISGRIRRHEGKYCYKGITKIKVYYVLAMTSQDEVSKFLNKIPVRHSEKVRRIKEWKQAGWYRKTFDGPYLPDVITSIREADSRRCRCLTVENDASFVANDFVVRNSTIACFLAADMLGRNPNERIMVVSHTETYSAQLLQFIEDIMRESAYKEMYGDLIPPRSEAAKWTSTQKFIRRSEWKSPHPSLLALGVGSSTIGYRATTILADDLVTQQNSLSPTMRTHLANWYFGSLTKRLDRPGGRIIIIGARFYTQDLYGELLNLYPHKVFSATPEVPLWPERFSSKMLEKERATNYIQFSAQYEQKPIDLESGFLRESDLHYYLEAPPRLHIFIACDLSHRPRSRTRRKSTSDPFAMSVAGYDPLNKIAYLLDFIETDASNAQQKSLIKTQAAHWNPTLITIESDAAQDIFVQQMIEETNLPIQGKTTGGVPKAIRYAGMAVHFRNKKVLVKGIMGMDGRMSPHQSMNKFIEGWRGFGSPSAPDHCLDAAELNLRAIFRIGGVPATGTVAQMETLPLSARHALFQRQRVTTPIFQRRL